MKYVQTIIPAAVLIGGLLTASAYAQEAAVVPTPTGPTQEKDTPPTPGTAEHAAQLQREHQRALAAGDHANDPLNPASSNDLNKQELAKALALGNDPTPAPSYAPPPDTTVPADAGQLQPPPVSDSPQPDTSSVQ
ncbi:MAG: hypothetical protein QM647_11065 [Asticcacaulis sp.]|uniref:hypothetical protein n=1 Tax=Asticcacaulis sp. TaxID=1872648 RepID=UPI0039E61B8F